MNVVHLGNPQSSKNVQYSTSLIINNYLLNESSSFPVPETWNLLRCHILLLCSPLGKTVTNFYSLLNFYVLSRKLTLSRDCSLQNSTPSPLYPCGGRTQTCFSVFHGVYPGLLTLSLHHQSWLAASTQQVEAPHQSHRPSHKGSRYIVPLQDCFPYSHPPLPSSELVTCSSTKLVHKT
jgi:hypothetical protein